MGLVMMWKAVWRAGVDMRSVYPHPRITASARKSIPACRNASRSNPARPGASRATHDVMNEDPPPLVIRMFGPFEASVNGAPLPRLRSLKGQWLLALLVLRHGAAPALAPTARAGTPPAGREPGVG